MSDAMADSPEYPPILQKDIRDILRRRGEPIPQTVSLQERDGTVRMTMMASAVDDLETVPDTVTQWYIPSERALVTLLPDGCSDSETTLEEFGIL